MVQYNRGQSGCASRHGRYVSEIKHLEEHVEAEAGVHEAE